MGTLPFAIETIQLTKRFPQVKRYREILLHPFEKKEITALQGVSLQVNRQDVFGILGPNGAGKTTLIKVLCTLISPTEGKALVNGLDVLIDGKRIRKSIGYIISDERSFYWRLTGRQNLTFFADLNNLTGKEACLRIDEVLELTDLRDEADKMFKDYSTGMKQKLAIARGLLTDPELIFMDEPTRSLDPSTAQHIRNFIRERLVREKKSTVLIATHNLQEAEEMCNRIAVIHRAKIRACGELSEIRKMIYKRSRYVLYLQNFPDALKSRWEKLPGITLCHYSHEPSGQIKLEVELEDKTSMTAVIESAVTMGAGVMAVYPKEASLSEIFSSLIVEGEHELP
jgi:ABC-2 type transport system ATP-binding protein